MNEARRLFHSNGPPTILVRSWQNNNPNLAVDIMLNGRYYNRAKMDKINDKLSTHYMMTSSNGNIFRVTGPLCGEFTGPGEFPTQRPVTRSFDVFLICVWINDWINNREPGDLRRYRAHSDVIVMTEYDEIKQLLMIKKYTCHACWQSTELSMPRKLITISIIPKEFFLDWFNAGNIVNNYTGNNDCGTSTVGRHFNIITLNCFMCKIPS